MEIKLIFLQLLLTAKEKIEKFMTKKPYNFIQITDGKNILDKLEVKGYPTTFLLDKNGNFIDFLYVHVYGQEEKIKSKIEKAIQNN